MNTLVLGWGNPILSDDGVGHRVAESLQDEIVSGDVTVLTATGSSLELLDLLTGYDRVIIIDAIETVGGQPGLVYRFDARLLPSSDSSTVHGVNFRAALELAECIGMLLPSSIIVYAIEVADVATLKESCTPAVAAAVPSCVELVLGELGLR